MVIAVDGPAASGKGTIAKALASHYGLPHLDTGALYRAVALSIIRAGDDPADAEGAARHARMFGDDLLHDPDIRSRRTGAVASVVSAHGRVRDTLLARQRAFAAQPGGAVLDGRDIGTVIAPDAAAKLFVTAGIDERARRRTAELAARGHDAELEAVKTDLIARDERDRDRDVAPLRPAPGATILDTTALGIEDAVAAAIEAVEAARGEAVRPGT
ncbi:(d)CMP kinase [Pacificimonas sp. WHA3]|uniref:Cytidylate kinase n=1 Tax=Pacificimonas pallii TaxID=2827236 RepID=A0ABS6SH36_9SPHN|nr:(d)CMP kinase [Pacificimonas pallii]MBV7257565.1 (d)CMP kinase [Pacificimonas pallii]